MVLSVVVNEAPVLSEGVAISSKRKKSSNEEQSLAVAEGPGPPTRNENREINGGG